MKNQCDIYDIGDGHRNFVLWCFSHIVNQWLGNNECVMTEWLKGKKHREK
jgi:hypothetical protein